jgi:hypothetical protein
MVVEKPLVVRANPMVDAYREAEEQECPSVKIGTLGLTEWFLPANLEGSEFADLCVSHRSYLSVKVTVIVTACSIVATSVPKVNRYSLFKKIKYEILLGWLADVIQITGEI